MQTRKLGMTGLTVSAIGLGCAQLGSSSTEYAVRLVRRALDLGVTYIDLARGYRDAEIKVGLALRPGERERLALSTKRSRRAREEARREIDESLERVGTGHFDNVHLHALQSSADIDQRLGPGGAMAALPEAREQGRVHHTTQLPRQGRKDEETRIHSPSRKPDRRARSAPVAAGDGL